MQGDLATQGLFHGYIVVTADSGARAGNKVKQVNK